MNDQNSVAVWDITIRIFHWTLVIGFTIAYITGEAESEIHAWAGYVILGLLVYRLVWGFIGTRYARFSSFLFSPGETLSYLGGLLRGKPGHYLGHNPAGALMVFALLFSLALTTVTGLVLYGEEGKGPLAQTSVIATAQADDDRDHNQGENEVLEELHEFFSHLTLLLVALHIGGVIVASRLEGQNLARAMVTGRKSVPK